MILAMPIEALSEADLDRLEQSTIPEETQEAQLPSSLESGRRRSVPRSRRPQMFEEIHLCAGPFVGPSYCARKYLPRINKRLEWECGGQPSQLHRLPLTSSDVSKSEKSREKPLKLAVLSSSDVRGDSRAATWQRGHSRGIPRKSNRDAPKVLKIEGK